MENYERRIGLKTIYLTLVRRFVYILLIFVPIMLVSFSVIRFGTKSTYQSTATVQKDAVFAAAHYQTFNSIVLSETTVKSASEKLAVDNVKHSNGKEITEADIKSGISCSSFNSSSQTITFTIYYKSDDQSITKKVLDKVAEASVEAALAKDAKTFAGLTVSAKASEGVDISDSKKYYMISAAVAAVLALGIPFIMEIYLDEVYDKKDVGSLGCEGFTLKL